MSDEKWNGKQYQMKSDRREIGSARSTAYLFSIIIDFDSCAQFIRWTLNSLTCLAWYGRAHECGLSTNDWQKKTKTKNRNLSVAMFRLECVATPLHLHHRSHMDTVFSFQWVFIDRMTSFFPNAPIEQWGKVRSPQHMIHFPLPEHLSRTFVIHQFQYLHSSVWHIGPMRCNDAAITISRMYKDIAWIGMFLYHTNYE